MKNFNSKGAFTLIELVIVVVILGILMSTILPKLTGGQARSRDAGRESDLRNIVSALNSYYDDFGDYPGRQGKAYCLPDSGNPSDSDITASHVSGVLMTYLQNKKVPTDPNNSSNGSLCNESGLGNYYYAPLIWKGLDKNSYLLCFDAENYNNANISVEEDLKILQGPTNFDSGAGRSLISDSDTVEKLYETSQERKFTKESDHGASDSVFCILRHN